MFYQALSVRQPYASAIALRQKTVEYRAWATPYRGPLVICATQLPSVIVTDHDHGGAEYRLPTGVTICRVTLADCVPWHPRFSEATMMHPDDAHEEGYAWVLADAVELPPVPVTGKRRLFRINVDPTDLKCF